MFFANLRNRWANLLSGAVGTLIGSTLGIAASVVEPQNPKGLIDFSKLTSPGMLGIAAAGTLIACIVILCMPKTETGLLIFALVGFCAGAFWGVLGWACALTLVLFAALALEIALQHFIFSTLILLALIAYYRHERKQGEQPSTSATHHW